MLQAKEEGQTSLGAKEVEVAITGGGGKGEQAWLRGQNSATLPGVDGEGRGQPSLEGGGNNRSPTGPMEQDRVPFGDDGMEQIPSRTEGEGQPTQEKAGGQRPCSLRGDRTAISWGRWGRRGCPRLTGRSSLTVRPLPRACKSSDLRDGSFPRG